MKEFFETIEHNPGATILVILFLCFFFDGLFHAFKRTHKK